MTKQEAVDITFEALKGYLAPNADWHYTVVERVKRILMALVEAVSTD